MEFVIEKNNKEVWLLSPLDGPLKGETVATAEGLNLAGVRFNGRAMVGVVKAAWGLTIAYEKYDIDPQTLRGLGIGRRFDADATERVRQDSDGFKDSFTVRLLHGAKQVVTMGAAIWTKGQY